LQITTIRKNELVSLILNVVFLHYKVRWDMDALSHLHQLPGTEALADLRTYPAVLEQIISRSEVFE